MAFERTQAFEEIFHARKITVVKVEGIIIWLIKERELSSFIFNYLHNM